MKIVHVIHAFPPDSRAGSENYAEALAREQMQRHEVVVFHRVSDAERPEYEVAEGDVDGIPVARINHTFRDLESFAGTYRNDEVAKAFGVFLDRVQPDLVHFHHVTCLSTTCVQEARQRGIVTLFTLHDFWLLCPRGQLLRRDLSLCDSHTRSDCCSCNAYQLPVRGGHERSRALWRRAAVLRRLPLPRSLADRLASGPFAREEAALHEIAERERQVAEMLAAVDHFVAPSRFLKERYVASGVPESRIHVSDYGFDLSHWPESGERRAAAEARPLRFAYLGTWIPSKGVHVLVEAFRGIDPEEASVDIHGYAVPFDGFEDYEGHLRDIARGAPNVHFRGAYAPDDGPRLLAEADALVVPSIWYENSPLTIHEAFMAGLPVVTSAHGGMQELVRDGENGLTFRPGDGGDLRRALLRLVREPGLLSSLARTATRVKSIQENAVEFEALYASLGAGSAASRAKQGGA